MGGKTSPEDKKPVFYATANYKRWMRARMKQLELTQDEMARRIKRVDATAPATGAGLAQFLGREDEDPMPSNTTMMPAINKVLGAAPPPICDPTNEARQIQDRIADRWSKWSERDRQILLRMLDEDP